MRTLILAAGRFGDETRRAIAEGREPRLDVFELAKKLDADVLDFLDVEKCSHPVVKGVARALGPSAGVAQLGFLGRVHYDAVLTTGEDIGLPFALLLKGASAKLSHTMIAHTLFPLKKRLFFKLGVRSHLDRVLAYSSSEERLMIDRLGIAADKVERIYYHADERFFRPSDVAVDPTLICAAGQLLRDYPCLIEAVRDLPVRVQIAAGSPWIEKTVRPQGELPPNVSWGKLNRHDLRDLYEKSAIAVVPILQNHYQTGIATILEMMAMGKCVIATRTLGQTDTIVDGVTGIYVPPSQPQALRQAIQRMLADPDAARRMGQAARRFVEEQAGLDRFVEKLSAAVAQGHAARSLA